MSKYHAQKTEIDGIVFDSKKEAQRYQQLKLMEKAGFICNLKRQVKYELIPAQYINGKLVERAVTYIADFEYDEVVKARQRTVMLYDDSRVIRQHIVEDVKGVRTDVYKIKRKMMLHKHGIRIREI